MVLSVEGVNLLQVAGDVVGVIHVRHEGMLLVMGHERFAIAMLRKFFIHWNY